MTQHTLHEIFIVHPDGSTESRFRWTELERAETYIDNLNANFWLIVRYEEEDRRIYNPEVISQQGAFKAAIRPEYHEGRGRDEIVVTVEQPPRPIQVGDVVRYKGWRYQVTKINGTAGLLKKLDKVTKGLVSGWVEADQVEFLEAAPDPAPEGE